MTPWRWCALVLIVVGVAGLVAAGDTAHPNVFTLTIGISCLSVGLFMALVNSTSEFVRSVREGARDHVRLLRQQEGRCTSCGYHLRGNQSGVCPECGSARPQV